jgi:hypothetical protein
MGGGGGSPAASSSSSSDDDGDATWKAAIESVAVGGFGYPSSNGTAKAASGGGGGGGGGVEASNGLEPPQEEEKAQAPGLKLYQIKVYLFRCFDWYLAATQWLLGFIELIRCY